ncbi:MAG: AraC family transcriptional regulator [Gammaproteobacteria bacterium]|nr:AraC family transcriptional regulator [Gammaproteobacteria bacterium]MDH5728459.1 AraC family transcriptional regulator [Gammaproteobacteria bacterium]
MAKNSKILYEQRLEHVLRYIDDHLEHPLNLEHIAQTAYFSPYHFHRLFHALTGETPNALITRLRLERAANQMLYQRKPSITDIALRSGFQTSSSFCNAFKKHFGINPSQWRKQNSKNGQVFINQLVDNQLMMKNETQHLEFPVHQQKRKALHIAYASSRSGYDEQSIAQAWQKILAWAESQHLLNDKTQYISIAFDNPDITQAHQCRYFAGIVIDDPCLITPAGIAHYYLPAGDYAILQFNEDIALVPTAYQYLYKHWLLQSEFQAIDSPTFEYLYQLGPDKNRRLRTDICLPIAPL